MNLEPNSNGCVHLKVEMSGHAAARPSDPAPEAAGPGGRSSHDPSYHLRTIGDPPTRLGRTRIRRYFLKCATAPPGNRTALL